jgi:hypothetical protein
MSFPKSSSPNKRLTRFAFFIAVAAQVIPCCYAFYTIATPTYYRGPLFVEFRYLILFLGLLSALLGALALVRGTASKALAIAAIMLGLIAATWHVLLCGTDPLRGNVLFCPMMWGVKYP